MVKSFLMLGGLLISFALVLGLFGFKPIEDQQTAQAPPSQPNVIVILADDMGYSDLGCYGGEAQTPNLWPRAAYPYKYIKKRDHDYYKVDSKPRY
jgi:hypothetical protein